MRLSSRLNPLRNAIARTDAPVAVHRVGPVGWPPMQWLKIGFKMRVRQERTVSAQVTTLGDHPLSLLRVTGRYATLPKAA